MNYSEIIDDYKGIFYSMFELENLLCTSTYGHLDLEDTEIVLDTISQVARDTLEPLQELGDQNPAKLVNGVVKTPPGYQEGYNTLAELGVMGISAETKYGGSGFPNLVQIAINEMTNGACISLGLNPLLTQSQIEALQKFAPENLKEFIIPKLVSGEWNGTMNITEPQAGSDVGSIQTIATKVEDQTYLVSGDKIYISWGDADLSKNICHLVLARIPSSPEGSKGLSLFLLLKYLEDHSGRFTKPNKIRILSLEKKLGLHGSPTASISFENAEATLIGEPNRGLEAMFAMMNSARLGVGVQGLGVAEIAYQKAKQFAFERKQGAVGGEQISIIHYPDIQRMIASMRAQIFSARAICSACAHAIDQAKITDEKYWKERAGLLTPVAKFYGSETGVEVSNSAIRVFGGAGYIEGTGIAQHLRDSLVTTIYEGTNGIQAIDLVKRKLGKDGSVIFPLLNEINEYFDSRAESPSPYCEELKKAGLELKQTTKWILDQTKDSNIAAGAQPYLKALAIYLGAYFHLRRFIHLKMDQKHSALIKVYFSRYLPYLYPLCWEITEGATGLKEFVSYHERV